MNNPTTWYRKRYALGGGVLGGATGYGIAHLLKGSSLTKLISAVAGAGIGGIAGYQIGKSKDIHRLSDVSVLEGDNTKRMIDNAVGRRNVFGNLTVPSSGYSEKAYEAGDAVDRLIQEKGDSVTAGDTANAVANNAEYTKTRLNQIEQYLKDSDQWERASLFGSVYRNKRTNAIYDLGVYKRRLNKSVPQFDTHSPYAIGIPYTARMNDAARYLFGRSAHIPKSEESKNKLRKLFNSARMRDHKRYGDLYLGADTSSFGTPMVGTPKEKTNSAAGQVSGHEYNHIGSALISDNLMPSNIQGTGMGVATKDYYSVDPGEVTQHISALNQRYHRLTGDYVKDKSSFFKAVKHLSQHIRDVDSEGRRTLQMLGGLSNDSKYYRPYERLLQNYAELAPVLI